MAHSKLTKEQLQEWSTGDLIDEVLGLQGIISENEEMLSALRSQLVRVGGDRDF